MDWKMLLACVTGSVDEELLLRNEYLVTENRIWRKHVEPHGDRGSRGRFGLLNLSLTPFVGQLHASLKPTATIGDNVLQVRPVLDHCTPTSPGAVWSSLAR